jgi:UDP-3-O-[3-hydroxymyristoyl] glucosamine N-acyltransferase
MIRLQFDAGQGLSKEDFDRLNNNFENIGFIDTAASRSLTFATTEKSLNRALQNPAVVFILAEKSLLDTLVSVDAKTVPMVNPQYCFVKIHNSLDNMIKFSPTVISKSSFISTSAKIDPFGVIIGDGVIVEDFVSIGRGTTIDENVQIHAGARIGTDSLYRTFDNNQRVHTMNHYGGVHINEDCVIGNNAVVGRAIFPYEHTNIGSGTLIGPNSNIAHGVFLGKNNFVGSSVSISGYTTIGDNNFFGPNSAVGHRIAIGDSNKIGMSAQVLRNIQDRKLVIGSKVLS